MRKYIAIIASVIIIFGLLRWNCYSLFSLPAYHLTAHSLLADSYRDNISSFVASLHEHHHSAHTIIAQLQQQFPVLNTIIIAYKPLATHITVQPDTPLCCVNNSLVLTSRNALVSKDIFTTSVHAKLPFIAVASDTLSLASPLIAQLLHKIPHHITQTHTIELLNEHYVKLVDKDQPKFSIVSCVEQEQSTLLAHCALIKKNINERAGFAKDVQWVADTRFAHYIVVYKT
jgi:hypothetical protein